MVLTPRPGMLTVRLLGGFGVWVGTRQVAPGAFPRPASAKLVKLLALQGGCRLHRDRVVDILWPDLGAERAVAQLYKASSHARKALGSAGPGATVALASQVVRLSAPEGVQCDLHAFELLARHALETRERGDLDAAAQAYRGEVLPDDAYEAWAELPRESARGLARDVLTALGEACLADGAVDEAARAIGRALREEPALERAHRLLMGIHARRGDGAALERQWRALHEALGDLGVEPAAELRELYGAARERIAAGSSADEISGGETGAGATGAAASPSSAAGAAGRRLPPAPARPLVGRHGDLERIGALLAEPGCRLLTLTGPGGVGKTALALEAVRRHGGAFAVVAVVSLEALDDPGLLPQALATALDLPRTGREDPEVLLHRRLAEGRSLMVLDNFEHLVAAAPLLGRLLDAAPEMRLVVTSRRRLGLAAEWLLEVPGLAWRLPDAAAGGAAGPSGRALPDGVRLFVDGVRRLRPGARFDDRELRIAAEICGMVGGLPLAIEFAASWCRTLTLDEIAAELRHGSELLVATHGDRGARHESMRAVFDGSWKLLSRRDRNVLADLATFRGGFGRAAAQAVADADLLALQRLVDASLLRKSEAGRFTVHPLVQRLAEEKPRGAPEAERAARERHARFFLDFLADRSEALRGPGQKQALDALDEELDNVRAAWQWAVARRGAELLAPAVTPLFFYFNFRGGSRAGARMLEAAVEALEGAPIRDPRALGNALGRLAWFRFALGELDGARRAGERALRELAPLGSCVERSSTLNALAAVASLAGAWSDAIERLEEALAIDRELGNPRGVAVMTGNIGYLASLGGDDAEARRRYERARDMARELENPFLLATNLANLGDLLLRDADPGAAASAFHEAQSIADANGFSVLLGVAELGLGRVAAARGATETAAEAAAETARPLLEGALERFGAGGEPQWIAETCIALARLHLRLGDVGAARESLRQALRALRSTGLATQLMRVLIGVAELHAREGAAAHARTILAFVLAEPRTAGYDRRVAGELLERLEPPGDRATGPPPPSSLPDVLEWAMASMEPPTSSDAGAEE